jgi:glycine oxidase
MTRRLDADVAVIGGGIIGLACAYELARLGKLVVVLEREHSGAGAGGVAAGMLAPVSEADAEEEELIDFALESCRLYPEWIRDVEATSQEACGFRTEGTLFVALHRDHAEELKRLASIQRRLGFDARLVTRDEALEKEPYLSPRVVSGLFVADDHQVNPRRLTRALAAAVTKLGSEVIEGAAAGPMLQDGRTVGAATPEVEVRAEAVIVAGGAWSADAWPEAAGPLPLRPVKGQIFRLRGEPIVRHVLRTPDVYLVPREDGELVVGATLEEQGFDTTVTAWAVMDILREAWRVVPGVAELEVAEIAAGLRPALRDHLPAIGATAVEGLFVATGHYRNGVMLAPATAKHLAQLITTGESPPSLAPFDPKRLLSPEPAGRTA